ncbi:MAG: hypothetical protein H6740_10710 [Alphaproteobacteria bacterium]|nr:hypothetical protein [Alphaproteobacteria bacterium]
MPPRKPDPEAQRAALEARREALRAELEAKTTAARAELERKREAAQQEPGKKNEGRRRWWLLALLPLLLLLRDCRCQEEPPPPEACPPCEEEPSPTGEAEPEPAPPRPLGGHVARQDRPEFELDPPKPLPWLEPFRRQVTARSPRLAECFLEAQRPGALRWSTLVDPARGTVAEHELEPMLLTDSLSADQSACVLRALEQPGYTLEPEADRATPKRVGLVIEF